MLYHRKFVKNWTPTTKLQRSLVSEMERDCLIIGSENIQILRSDLARVCKEKSFRRRLSAFTKLIATSVIHDAHLSKERTYRGFKTPLETLAEGSGHCLEINTLLYYALKGLFPEESKDVRVILGKNPKGPFLWGENGIDDYGVHLFVLFNHDGHRYLADSVDG